MQFVLGKLGIKVDNSSQTINAYFAHFEMSCHVKTWLRLGNMVATVHVSWYHKATRTRAHISYLEFTSGVRHGDVSAMQHHILTETVYVTHQLQESHAVSAGGRQSVILCPRQGLQTANWTQQFNRWITQHHRTLSSPKIIVPCRLGFRRGVCLLRGTI